MTYKDIPGRWLFYAALIVFIAFKIPYLYQAFYWDESWVYAPAIKLMYEHGPSLRPDAIPVEFSRGHPLLYQAGCAAWMKLFGGSNFSMHSFALAVSLVFAVAVYEVMRTLFNARVALTAGLMLLVNITFFCESSAVLTDVPLALFAFLSLYFYVHGRYVPAMLLLTLLYYTKESGWVMAGVLMLDVAVALYNCATTRSVFMRCLTIVVPLAITAAYFIEQKIVLGWYLNPGHLGIMNWGLQHTLYNVQNTFIAIFWHEQIYLTYLLMGLVFLALFVRTKQSRYLKIVIAGVFFFLNVIVFTDKDAIFYVDIVLLIAAIVWVWVYAFPTFSSIQARFLKLIVAFSTLYIYFCCINFFEERYLFPVLFFVSIVLYAVVFEKVTTLFSGNTFRGALLLVLLLSMVSYFADSNELLQSYRIKVQQQLVTYLEEEKLYDKSIYCPSFLNRVHLNDPNTGFLASHKRFTRVGEVWGDSIEIAVFDNIEPDPFRDSVVSNDQFYLVQQFACKHAWAEVFVRRTSTQIAPPSERP